MFLTSLRALALCALALVAPLGTAAFAASGDEAAKQVEAGREAEQNPDETTSEPDEAPETKAPEATAEDKRICRHVRLDASSRRKTKVCRTAEEWRELNNPR